MPGNQVPISSVSQGLQGSKWGFMAGYKMWQQLWGQEEGRKMSEKRGKEWPMPGSKQAE